MRQLNMKVNKDI